jgi:hypothetical protein
VPAATVLTASTVAPGPSWWSGFSTAIREKAALLDLSRYRPGIPDHYPDATLFGQWYSFSPKPCEEGPGEFSLALRADFTVVITAAGEAPRAYRVEELRRTGMSPRAWERGSVVLTAAAPDGRRVRMLFRQTRPNIMEPFMYEVQDPAGDITLLTDPPPLVNCAPAS